MSKQCFDEKDFFLLKITSDNNSSSVSSNDLSMNDSKSFRTNAFFELETKFYADKWSIPVKRK